MSSSTRDSPALVHGALVTGERLAELLSVIAEARDFHSAADFFLGRLVEVAGAKRGCLLAVLPGSEELRTIACTGFDGEESMPSLKVSLSELRHPFVLSAFTLLPLACDGPAARRHRLPFPRLVAIPLPAPSGPGTRALIEEGQALELMTECSAHIPMGSAPPRRAGRTGFGVVVLDTVPGDVVLRSTWEAALLAGPLLARMAALEEYRRSSERLDQQRDLLTAIVNSLPDPIIITDEAGDIVVQNARAEHLLSFRDGDSEGRRRAVEINNLLFTSFLSKSVMAGGITSGSRELNLVDPDEGTDLLFEVLAHRLSPGISRSASFVSVLRDVTDLRRAANELERQVQRVRLAEFDATRERDRLNLILENVADPILVTDDRSNIILMNRFAEELLQLDEATSRSRTRVQAVRNNDTKFTTFISDFTLSHELNRRERMRLVHPETGRDLPVEVVSGKILNDRGEPMAIVSVLHDLTKQVENERLYHELKRFSGQLEERIRAATADLAEQNARLQWQSRELEKANRLKSEFLASMSHELRTPINALIGYTALMLDRIYGDLTAKQDEGLRRIQSSAQHLLALINDILDLAKIEAGKMPLHLEDLSVEQLVGEITQQIEPLVRKKSLEFECAVPEDTPFMHSDRMKVKQILLNLLSNAVKFTRRGRVALEVVPLEGGDKIRFDVIDTGIGIEPRDLEAIWEDFRQLDQSRTREYGGTGLGLSITRKLVARLGGTIAVQSSFGEGTTFAVTLPVRTTASDVAPPGVDAPVILGR